MAKRKLGDTNGDPSKVLALEMDIISALSHAGVGEVVENVFSYLDDVSLLEAEKVCRKWSQIIDEGDEFLWRNVLQEKLERDPLWRQLSARKTWMKEVLNVFPALPCSFEKYRDIYFAAFKDLRRLNQNWESGNCERFSIPVTQVEKLMLNGSKIVGVVTTPEKIKVWDRENYRCIWSADVPSGIVSAQLNENILIASSMRISVLDQASNKTNQQDPRLATQSTFYAWLATKFILVNTLSINKQRTFSKTEIACGNTSVVKIHQSQFSTY